MAKKQPVNTMKTSATDKLHSGSSIGNMDEISLDLIDIGKIQVRTDLSSGIDDLAESIRKQGLIQPIYVAKKSNGHFEILAGQRRFLAHQKLKLKTIRAVVIDDASLEAEPELDLPKLLF